MVELRDVNEKGSFKVYWENGAYIGDFVVGEDGYLAYWPVQKCGYITAHFMRAVADKLDETNERWDKIIQSDPNISK